MADRPILFSAPMVRALLAGTKTQTRRILNIPHQNPLGVWESSFVGGKGCFYADGKPASETPCVWHTRTGDVVVPRFCVGDRLWVRESWRTEARYDGLKPSEIPAGALCSFEADYDYEPNDGCRGKYRHARFMPHWASRITLTVTDVRVQRLLDITEDDARAEGFTEGQLDDGFGPRDIGGGFTIESPGTYCSPAGMFQETWAKLHPDWDGFSSPWVAALTFTVERRNIDA